jgi:hypothetical protein
MMVSLTVVGAISVAAVLMSRREEGHSVNVNAALDTRARIRSQKRKRRDRAAAERTVGGADPDTVTVVSGRDGVDRQLVAAFRSPRTGRWESCPPEMLASAVPVGWGHGAAAQWMETQRGSTIAALRQENTQLRREVERLLWLLGDSGSLAVNRAAAAVASGGGVGIEPLAASLDVVANKGYSIAADDLEEEDLLQVDDNSVRYDVLNDLDHFREEDEEDEEEEEEDDLFEVVAATTPPPAAAEPARPTSGAAPATPTTTTTTTKTSPTRSSISSKSGRRRSRSRGGSGSTQRAAAPPRVHLVDRSLLGKRCSAFVSRSAAGSGLTGAGLGGSGGGSSRIASEGGFR